MHATAKLKMAKSKTKVRNIWQKLIYFCAYSLSNFSLQICFNNCLVFRIHVAKTRLDVTFPRKRHFLDDVIITSALNSDI